MAQDDEIVVGAGSAGAVVAARLAEDPDARVLLLEGGGDDRKHPEIARPAAWPSTLQGTDIDWQYETTPQKHANGRVGAVPRGRVLGGSSAINALVSVGGRWRHPPGHARSSVSTGRTARPEPVHTARRSCPNRNVI